MARVHFVKAARKENRVANKGESYYWWKPRGAGKQFSKEYPTTRQLNRSEFWEAIYEAGDMIANIDPTLEGDEVQCEIDQIIDHLESLSSETSDKFDNMPEGLQQGDTGQLLEGRVDAVDGWVGEIRNFDVLDTDSTQDEIAGVVDEVQATSYQGE